MRPCGIVAIAVLLHSAAARGEDASTPAAPRFGDATLRIAIDFDEWADPDHVVVALDGKPLKIPRDSVATAVPVSAGAHLVTVFVGTHVVWSKQIILLPDDDEVVSIAPEMADVPPLEPEPEPAPPQQRAEDPDDEPWPRELVLRPPTLKARMVAGGVLVGGVFGAEEVEVGITQARVGVGVSSRVELDADVTVCFDVSASCGRFDAGGAIRGRVLRRGDETLTLAVAIHSLPVQGQDERLMVSRVGGVMRTHSRRAALAVDLGLSVASGDRDARRGHGGYHVGAEVVRQVGRDVALAAGAGLFSPNDVRGAYIVTFFAGGSFAVASRVDLTVGAARPVAFGNVSLLTTTELTVGIFARY